MKSVYAICKPKKIKGKRISPEMGGNIEYLVHWQKSPIEQGQGAGLGGAVNAQDGVDQTQMSENTNGQLAGFVVPIDGHSRLVGRSGRGAEAPHRAGERAPTARRRQRLPQAAGRNQRVCEIRGYHLKAS